MTPNVSAVSKPIRCLESGVLNLTADLRQLDNMDIFQSSVSNYSFTAYKQKSERFKQCRTAENTISLLIAINTSRESWNQRNSDDIKTFYTNLDANAVSFIPNCSYLSPNILNPNAREFLPYKMINDNCATSTICGRVFQPRLNFTSFIYMPSSLNVYATPYIPLKFRLSSSVLNPNVAYVSYKGDTISIVIIALMKTCFILSVFVLNDIMTVDLSPKVILKNIKLKNANKIVFGHLNVNSLRNKFQCLKDVIGQNIDIFLVSETKLNDSFPDAQFFIDGFRQPYRKDRTDKGGGLILYVHNNIPSRVIDITFAPLIEALVIEINLKKKKWLLICSYNPHKSMIQNHLYHLGKSLDELCKIYDNLILMGDYNCEISEDAMNDFCCVYNLSSLVEAYMLQKPNSP